MPTVDIPDKICSHCGGTKWKIEMEKRTYHIRTRYRCAKRAQERSCKSLMKNPERQKEYSFRQNKRRVESGYYKTSKYRAFANEVSKKHSVTLSDKYIKYILRHNKENRNFDVTPELIELKRKQLLLKRQIKNNGKIQKTISSGS